MDVFEWIDKVFLNKFESNKNLLNDQVSYLIGNVKLRQLRIKNSSCSRFYFDRICFKDYDIFNEDKSDFISNLTFSNYSKISDAFKYTKSSDLEGQPYLGSYSNYMGGGFVYKIENFLDLNQTKQEIFLLQKLNWIDKHTRALFIEFSLFNPNVNLFAYCTILFEYLPTGEVLNSININPFALYNYESPYSIAILVFDIIYLVIIIFLMINELRKLVKSGCRKYFSYFWVYIQWTLILISWSIFFVYIYKLISRNEILNKLKNKKDINLQGLSYWNSLLVYLFGFCTFILTIKFIKLFRFNSVIACLIECLKLSSVYLLNFLFIFGIVWISFVKLLYLLLGSKFYEFSTLMKTIETTFQIMLGKFQTEDILKHDFTFILLVIVAFDILIILIMMTFLL